MGNKRRRRSKSKRRRQREIKRALVLAAMALVLALIVFLCVQLVLRSYIGKFDSHRIIHGVSIGTIDVSNLTAAKAKDVIEAELASLTGKSLTLTLDETRSGAVDFGALGLSVKDLDNVVQSAVDYGKKGSTFKCYKILKKAEKNENKKKFKVDYTLARKTAKESMETALSGVLSLPENARVTQTESGVTVVEEKPGEEVDMKKTTKSISEFLNTKWDDETGNAKVYVTHIDPAIKAADLKDVTDLLGSFSTFYGSDGSGRAQNIESGTNHLNGLLLKPGEELSANAAMEPYTEENGFAMAASYEDDKVVESMGGGICQISTTLYNALLYSELEITERSPHTMLVSYVEPSQDAAIADDVKDLKFKNNLASPVYVEGVLSEGTLTFNIYGKETRDSGRTLEFVSEKTAEKMPEGKRYIATEDAIGNLYTKTQAQAEISAQLWKVVYQDGVEQSRDVINYSQYVPAKETIAVGSASENEEYTKKIKIAVETQDEAKITQAIKEITGN